MNKSLVEKAIWFAKEKHKDQKRKVTGLPYITHLSGVALLLKIFKKSKNLDELIAAGYLHDTLEDTKTNYEELLTFFGPLVASLVLEVTNDKSKYTKATKMSYMQQKMLNMSSYALSLKLCDRLHNITDYPTRDTLVETVELIDFIEKNRSLSKTQQTLVEEIRKVLNGN
jgi:(p)ppGpp synthase/HD superfamily hydrolase